jgi:hypothetical protein
MQGRMGHGTVAVLAGWAVLGLGLAAPAAAQGSLNVYCSVQLEWCQALANEFTRQSGIKVAITQKGSGEVFAQIKAEAANPRADVWFGGTGDPHLQAAEQNLTQPYRSPTRPRDWPTAGGTGRVQDGGHLRRRLSFGYNPELLQKKLPPHLLERSGEAGVQDEIGEDLARRDRVHRHATIVTLRRGGLRYPASTRTSTSTPAPAPAPSRRWRGARRPSASASCTTA